jgi:hypothetical protein
MIKVLNVESIEISGIPALDPISVYWEDYGDGRGRVTITCYGEAWTAYWGAMEKDTIKSFFSYVDVDYITNRLQGAQFQKHTVGHFTYLKRIVTAIKSALNEPPQAEKESA